MMRAIFFSLIASMLWTEAMRAEAKCESPPTAKYKEGVNLMMSTLSEPGPGKWWKGEPQIAYDFEIVNYQGNLAVRVRPAGGGSNVLMGDGVTLGAKICRVKTVGNEPPTVNLSIDTSQYYGKWSEVFLMKVKSVLHVNWDGKVAALKPTS